MKKIIRYLLSLLLIPLVVLSMAVTTMILISAIVMGNTEGVEKIYGKW